MHQHRKAATVRPGFTLVEILIVVAILAILAAMVIPQFTDATAESQANSTKMNLNRIRTQIEIYRQQHDGRYPTLAGFVDQMTTASNLAGETAPVGTPEFTLGPYIYDMPRNPLTGGNTVGDGEIGTSDWFYDETDGTFRPNDSETSATW